MLTLGLCARLEAEPGKEQEVAALLEQGLQRAKREGPGAAGAAGTQAARRPSEGTPSSTKQQEQ